MSNWLDKLQDMTSESEAPDIFVTWAGLATIAAVMRKQVYFDKYFYKVYPNIYALLVAKSGGRKSLPITIAKSLVSSTNHTKVISGRNSIQAIVKDLARAWTLEGGKILKDATAFVCSEEFTTLLVDDDQALPILTTLYDTSNHDKHGWVNTLKGEGQERLMDPCLTMLGASNEVHFKNKVSNVNFMGGFVGRTLLIYDDSVPKINALMEPPTKVFDVESLLPYLVELTKLKGKFTITDNAKKMYVDWYSKFRQDEIEEDDPTGTRNRLQDQVLKVAMLLVLSERLELVIDQVSMQRSLDLCSGFAYNAKRMSEGSGKAQFADQTASFIHYMLGRIEFRASREQILKKFWKDFDAIDFDRMAQTLIEAGAMKQPASTGGKTVYQLTTEFVLEYKKNEQAVSN